MDSSLMEPATKADLLALENRLRSFIDGKTARLTDDLLIELKNAIRVEAENRTTTVSSEA